MDLTLEQFCKKVRSVNFPQYEQFTGCFSRKKQVVCAYHVYVCIDTLQVINPYTKKDAGRKYKSFVSYASADDAKEKAYNYIKSLN